MVIIIPSGWLKDLVTKKLSELSEEEKEQLEAWNNSRTIMYFALGVLGGLVIYSLISGD